MASTAFISAVLRPLLEAASGVNLGRTGEEERGRRGGGGGEGEGEERRKIVCALCRDIG